jgi:hypothetical protein
MDFYSLQELYTHTKGVTYIIIVLVLIGFVFFWRFLTDRDHDEDIDL